MKFTLPMPPSANALFFNRRSGKGRGKTAKYRAWIKNADAHYTLQGLGKLVPIKGPYKLTVTLPKTRLDIDNAVKGISDILVRWHLTGDDSLMRKLSVEIDTTLTDVGVEIDALSGASQSSDLGLLGAGVIRS